MSAASVPGWARVVAELQERISELEARVGELERRRGPRDTEDRALLGVLADSTGGLPFQARDVFEHAERVDPRLRSTLEAATISTAGELGCWLRRMAGARGGLRVMRDRRLWRVLHIDTSMCGD